MRQEGMMGGERERVGVMGRERDTAGYSRSSSSMQPWQSGHPYSRAWSLEEKKKEGGGELFFYINVEAVLLRPQRSYPQSPTPPASACILILISTFIIVQTDNF